VPSTFTAWPENLPNRMRSRDLDIEAGAPAVSRIALPTANVFAWSGFGDRVGNDDSLRIALLIETLHDRILFGKFSGQAVKVEGREYLVMREDDIMGVVAK